ncbi:hypothetical protein SISNIDRAFT_232797 [Sistotremastrum niveocremeum HHB9708]|uniref:Uncharacterized protein n=1 Tax=Sistotremastrum niveocremeum HHB9708 TaxID=1314777 RepID=A0A164Q1T1_9AGAM|nr:hypothetical protein SISNIDRAFT_232797 [Sistotremastrum niveocremeum HHB9708]
MVRSTNIAIFTSILFLSFLSLSPPLSLLLGSTSAFTFVLIPIVPFLLSAFYHPLSFYSLIFVVSGFSFALDFFFPRSFGPFVRL